jgi:ADP-ribose pyrophosphatase YjhB (NUDIX family)
LPWEDELARKLRQRFNLDGRLTVVANRDDSDIYYTVSVLEFRRLPLSYDSIGRPARWRLSLRTGAVLTEPPDRVIFSDEKVWAYLEYSEVEQPVLSREQAMDRLLNSMADRLMRKAVSGWYTELMSDRELGKEK